jgi:hypothetical protein
MTRNHCDKGTIIALNLFGLDWYVVVVTIWKSWQPQPSHSVLCSLASPQAFRERLSAAEPELFKIFLSRASFFDSPESHKYLSNA